MFACIVAGAVPAIESLLVVFSGVSQLPLQVLPALERLSKLVLWLGWDARSFAKKLGERRCYLVHPTAGQLTPRQAVTEGLDAREIVRRAPPLLHQSITTFATLRQDVLSELHNIDKVVTLCSFFFKPSIFCR
ncbi:hypothetical protein PR048_032106 [Dryococelus australis]|uniref:Uncharacterized protein n=1 Tax=Dryococelus australis TaxID=614101 RepID=A0ABQ9G4I4_9NEOP|nr:hypothetical protein PR048_032106 [Dryococelus australis]